MLKELQISHHVQLLNYGYKNTIQKQIKNVPNNINI